MTIPPEISILHILVLQHIILVDIFLLFDFFSLKKWNCFIPATSGLLVCVYYEYVSVSSMMFSLILLKSYGYILIAK